MTDKIILTHKDIVNIKRQIRGAKEEINKAKKYILGAQGGIKNLEKGIKLNEKKLAKGEIKHEIVNGIDLTELKLPFHCYYEEAGPLKRKRKGLLTSFYHGRMEYQLHDNDPHNATYYPTMIWEEFNLVLLIKKWNIKKEEK